MQSYAWLLLAITGTMSEGRLGTVTTALAVAPDWMTVCRIIRRRPSVLISPGSTTWCVPQEGPHQEHQPRDWRMAGCAELLG
jgi:hypothetical protein